MVVFCLGSMLRSSQDQLRVAFYASFIGPTPCIELTFCAHDLVLPPQVSYCLTLATINGPRTSLSFQLTHSLLLIGSGACKTKGNLHSLDTPCDGGILHRPPFSLMAPSRL